MSHLTPNLLTTSPAIRLLKATPPPLLRLAPDKNHYHHIPPLSPRPHSPPAHSARLARRLVSTSRRVCGFHNPPKRLNAYFFFFLFFPGAQINRYPSLWMRLTKSRDPTSPWNKLKDGYIISCCRVTLNYISAQKTRGCEYVMLPRERQGLLLQVFPLSASIRRHERFLPISPKLI